MESTVVYKQHRLKDADESNRAVLIRGRIEYNEMAPTVPGEPSNTIVSRLLLHSTDDYAYNPVILAVNKSSVPMDFELELRPRFVGAGTFYLIVRAYTRIRTASGLYNYSAEGWAQYSVDELRTAMAPGGCTRKIEMYVPTVSIATTPSSIGTVKISISTLTLQNAQLGEGGGMVKRTSQEAALKSVAEKIDKEKALLEKLQNEQGYSLLEKMKCYKYLSESTPPSIGKLPAIAFLWGPDPQANAEFWNDVQWYIEMRGTMDIYKKAPNQLTETELTAIYAVHMVLLLPQWLDYVKDLYITPNRATVEVDYFMNALAVATLADDCDGLTRAVISCARSLRNIIMHYAGSNSIVADPKYCTARTFRSAVILRHYVVCAMVSGAYGGEMDVAAPEGTYGRPGDVNYIDTAHMCCYFIPVKYFIECVRRGSPSHPISQLDTGLYMADLPVLMGDASDRVDPYGIADPGLALRGLLTDIKLKNRIKPELIYNRKRYDGYVRHPVMCLTTDFMDAIPRDRGCRPINVGAFYFSRPITGNGLARGVPQHLLMQKSDSVCILPGPEYTALDVQFMREEAALAAPVIRLVKPAVAVAKPSLPDLSKLEQLVSTRQISNPANAFTASICVRSEQFAFPDIGQYLQALVARTPEIKAVHYHLESVVDGVEGYCIVFTLERVH